MNIRKKLLLVCLSLTTLFNLSHADGVTPPYNKKELLLHLIRVNDKNLTIELNRQLTEKDKV